MARQIYGNTWWGEQWLDALSHIDFDNRLPRGRSYANKGAVRDLLIRGGAIQAKVQGSRPRPYQVSIGVPPFPASQVDKLLGVLAGEPALIAAMLNRELDPKVLAHARTLDIAVFPTKWQDLDMQCSCPDWAVPCKHLAAAIYLLSREIDGNPFLVFSLRGLDLTLALKARGIHIETQTSASLPAIRDLLPALDGEPVHASDLGALESLNFSIIPDLGQTLWRMLPERPAFSPSGDFQAISGRILARASKAARQALVTEPSGDSLALARQRPILVIDGSGRCRPSGNSNFTSSDALLHALAGIAPSQFADLYPEIIALYHIRLTALQLMARGAIVPHIYTIDDGEIALRWLPASLDPQVRTLMQSLSDALPSGLLLSITGTKRTVLKPQAQAEFLCALFLRHFIRQWCNAAQQNPLGDKTIALFFGAGTARYDGPGEREVSAGIQSWLARFHLKRSDAQPVLCIDAGSGDDFALTVAVDNAANALEQPVPMALVLTEQQWDTARYPILQTVSMLAQYVPPLQSYINAGASVPIALAADDLPDLLFDALPVVRLLGIRVLMPKELDRLLRPRLSMQVTGKVADAGGFLSMDDVLAFNWKIAIGEHMLTATEFDKLVEAATGVVRFKGGYVFLDPHELERLRAQLKAPPTLSSAELLRVALAGEYGGAPLALDAKATQLISTLSQAGAVALPNALNATLRPYQQRGYEWLYRNARIGFGSVLADDMGLGKTLQVIATLQKLREDGALEQGKAIIIVPTSLLTNWQKELARFAPELSVDVFHGSRRELASLRPDVLLTTFGIARSKAKTLQTLAWQIMVVDEAQNIKNPAAAQTRAVKAIPAKSCIAMSGTPVENRLSEYWSIMDFVNCGYLGNLSAFVRDYANPIQLERDEQVAQRFKRVTAPFLMRRLKSDKSIISDLPDKITQQQYCALTPNQSALYESVVQEGLKSIAGESNTFQRQGLVLQMILALKQVCNHPALYLKQALGEALDSGKALRFFELIDEIHASGQKVLVFTQFREMGELLRAWLHQRNGHDPLFLHGGVARAKRDAMVERFQNDGTERIFILSLKAGGTGLNLTAASHVIHYDLWWNPAVEAQATDRAYRIGQQRNVQVHRLITQNTFEERIDAMISRKRELAELAVGTGEKWVGNLSQEELALLFQM